MTPTDVMTAVAVGLQRHTYGLFCFHERGVIDAERIEIPCHSV